MAVTATTYPFRPTSTKAELPRVGTSASDRCETHQEHQGDQCRAPDIREKLDNLILEQEERIKRRRRDADRQADNRGYRMPKADWRCGLAEARLKDLRDISDFLRQECDV